MMKFVSAILSLLLATATADYPIEVDVHCKNVDFTNLSDVDKVGSSKILEDTYGVAHRAAGDDAYITDLHWLHAIKNVRSTQSELGSWVQQSSSAGGGWNGSAGCTLCPNDDFLGFSSGGKAHTAWEKTATASLKSLPGFKDAQDCKIVIKSLEDFEEEAEVDVVGTETHPVEIDVHCKNVDFKKLSVGDQGFGSKALQDTYNTIYKNDDSFLTNVHWMHVIDAEEEATNLRNGVQQSSSAGGGWNGSAGCTLCPNDDFFGVTSSGNKHKEWQHAFTEAAAGSDTAFKKAKDCSIKLKTLQDSAQE